MSSINHNILDEEEDENPFSDNFNFLLPKEYSQENFPPLFKSDNEYSESPLNSTNYLSKKNNSDSNSLDELSEKQVKTEHPIFQTEKNADIIKKGIEFKLLMNRLSAKKSRQKKKNYIKKLEEESANHKNEIFLQNLPKNSFDGINLPFFNHLRLIEQQEKEIKELGQKKTPETIKQYELLEKTAVRELLIKQINLLIPIRYRIFGEKNIKLVQLLNDDSFSIINTKIDENLIKINNFLDIVSKKRIKPVIKLKEIYTNLKKYVEMFQLIFNQNF